MSDKDDPRRIPVEDYEFSTEGRDPAFPPGWWIGFSLVALIAAGAGLAYGSLW
ncbi:hypothetical protein ACRARG_12725 [Pseudooceanicola sp. C21-150M6]|uniref:hypothetical protein n=1 Tax=Pseudooceanicola sp. C21-150M6 TaxID=3434355 RepID=UPI003D7F7ACC